MQRSVWILGTVVIAVAFAFASPASAKSRQRGQAAPQSQYSQVAAAAQNNPTCVYNGGQLMGCDPDPNIRQRLGQYNGYAAVK